MIDNFEEFYSKWEPESHLVVGFCDVDDVTCRLTAEETADVISLLYELEHSDDHVQ